MSIAINIPAWRRDLAAAWPTGPFLIGSRACCSISSTKSGFTASETRQHPDPAGKGIDDEGEVGQAGLGRDVPGIENCDGLVREVPKSVALELLPIPRRPPTRILIEYAGNLYLQDSVLPDEGRCRVAQRVS